LNLTPGPAVRPNFTAPEQDLHTQRVENHQEVANNVSACVDFDIVKAHVF